LAASVAEARHLSKEVSKVPTPSHGIAISQSEALMSSIVCRAFNLNSPLAVAMHYSQEW
jgi:hypothetical protein